MIYKITIPGTLPGLNDYIAALDRNRHIGNQLKQQAQNKVILYARKYLRGAKINKPVNIYYQYYEPNRKRDKDNISGFAHKVIQDALVSCNALPNDGWQHVNGFADAFFIDRSNPRIVITVEEV